MKSCSEITFFCIMWSIINICMSQKTIGMMLQKGKTCSPSIGLLHLSDAPILNHASEDMRQICLKCIINGKFWILDKLKKKIQNIFYFLEMSYSWSMQRQAALCVIIKKVKNMTEILATLGYLKVQMIMIFIRQIICLKLITSIMIIMKLLKIWETNLLGEIIKVEI